MQFERIVERGAYRIDLIDGVAEIVGNIGTAKSAADQIKRKMNE